MFSLITLIISEHQPSPSSPSKLSYRVWLNERLVLYNFAEFHCCNYIWISPSPSSSPGLSYQVWLRVWYPSYSLLKFGLVQLCRVWLLILYLNISFTFFNTRPLSCRYCLIECLISPHTSYLRLTLDPVNACCGWSRLYIWLSPSPSFSPDLSYIQYGWMLDRNKSYRDLFYGSTRNMNKRLGSIRLWIWSFSMVNKRFYLRIFITRFLFFWFIMSYECFKIISFPAIVKKIVFSAQIFIYLFFTYWLFFQ